jgi:hypothetical protein
MGDNATHERLAGTGARLGGFQELFDGFCTGGLASRIPRAGKISPSHLHRNHLLPPFQPFSTLWCRKTELKLYFLRLSILFQQ